MHTMKIVTKLLILLFTTVLFAQENGTENNPFPLKVEKALEQESLTRQFDYVIKKSNRYLEFKVIKGTWITKLRANAMDSIQALESKIVASNLQISKQKETISGLEQSLEQTNNKLTAVTQEKDSMNFLGMPFSKSSYKTLMWSIAGVLLALLLFFAYRFKNSNAITINAKKSLLDVEQEFEDHRRRSLEREQKVNRRLQDEINKSRNKSGV